MFPNLLRRLFASVDRVRVGFVSQPIALAASDQQKRPVRSLSLDEWLALDDRNGDDDAVASIDKFEDGLYATIIRANTNDVLFVRLKDNRGKFLAEFYDEKAIRIIVDGGIRALKVNPPPPPPPPGKPPWELVARLDAMIQVVTIPVVATSVIPESFETQVNVRG